MAATRVALLLLVAALFVGCSSPATDEIAGEGTDAAPEEAAAEVTDDVPDEAAEEVPDEAADAPAEEVPEEGPEEEPAASPLTNDAEPTLQFDVGTIEEVVDDADGTWLRFDRYQEYGTGRAGPELDREPRYEGASDVGYVNENPQLRSYPVSETVEVLLIDPTLLEKICSGDDVAEDIFLDSTLDELLADEVWLVSLTFDEAGEVIRIRDQKGC